MSNYSVIFDNGIRFNIKAQTLNQAANKVSDFRLDIYGVNGSTFTVYTDTAIYFNKELPFLTMTKAINRRYKVNKYTNKKVLKLFGIEVPKRSKYC